MELKDTSLSTYIYHIYMHKQSIMACVPWNLNTSLITLQPTLIINPRRACAERVTVVVSCVCVCMYVCLSEHAILAVRAVRSITKDAIVLSVRFAAIIKRRFS